MKRNYNPLLSLFIVVISYVYRPVNEISITITNLRNDKGQVLISLFKGDDGYPDKSEKAFRKSKVAIMSGNTTIINFPDLPPGKYAAVVLHDENNNMKMDMNWLGLPKEGYGFSNNVMGTFGPPDFSKASFRHDGDMQTAIVIKLRY